MILDFFAGSGIIGQAVMELNREDNANRKFILCTNHENEIVHKIIYERLYRIIKGKVFKDNKNNFDWLKNNIPYANEKLRVIDIDDEIKISLDQDISPKVYNDAKNGLKLLDALNPLENDEDKFS